MVLRIGFLLVFALVSSSFALRYQKIYHRGINSFLSGAMRVSLPEIRQAQRLNTAKRLRSPLY